MYSPERRFYYETRDLDVYEHLQHKRMYEKLENEREQALEAGTWKCGQSYAVPVASPKKKKKKKFNGERAMDEEWSSLSSTPEKLKKKHRLDSQGHNEEQSEENSQKRKRKKHKKSDSESVDTSTDGGSFDIEVSTKHKKKKDGELQKRGNGEIEVKEKHNNSEKLNGREVNHSFSSSDSQPGENNTQPEENRRKKKHKKRKRENEIDSSELEKTPVDAPKKKKKKKHLQEHEQQGNETVTPDKNKTTNGDDSDVKEELMSSGSVKKSKKESKITTQLTAIKELFPIDDEVKSENTKDSKEEENLHSVVDLGVDVIKEFEKPFTDDDTSQELAKSPLFEKPKKQEKNKKRGAVIVKAEKSPPERGLKIKKLFSVSKCDDDEVLKDKDLSSEIKKIKEEKRLSSAEEKVLKKLHINLPWRVPPLHMVETRVAVRPNKEQKMRIEELAVEVKTGSYTKLEDVQIRANWEKFCKMHELAEDPKPFLNLVNSDRKVTFPTNERINFVRFLAHKLDNRLLCSVYNRFRRLFQAQEIRSGRFTTQEDEKIVEYIQSSSSRTPYSDLAVLLNRTKTAIEKRAQKLVLKFNNAQTSVIKWDKKKIEEFLTNFVEVTQVEEITDLKTREVTTEEWRQMESRMKIPMVKLRNAWMHTIYSKIFTKRKLKTSRVRKYLIRTLVERGENDLRAINWNSIQTEMEKKYEGFTGQKLNTMLQSMINYHVPATKRHNLKVCLKYLEEACNNGGIRGQKVKRFKVIDNR
ncbi:hypothetical protein Zmor_004724 [Zophobas morio]|uniref:Uncharacterized protein n=1 Tax=Zophobas morio TaxID=2755281 RepID=A0AA38ILZ4_9CUCU|nr:hypothetical protein Zmor_004724 [Zophobas morio]